MFNYRKTTIERNYTSDEKLIQTLTNDNDKIVKTDKKLFNVLDELQGTLENTSYKEIEITSNGETYFSWEEFDNSIKRPDLHKIIKLFNLLIEDTNITKWSNEDQKDVKYLKHRKITLVLEF